jgi:divalent metal cation (Fe/Co/Zn/Cd) transporter
MHKTSGLRDPAAAFPLATERYPYGLERAEDLAGIGIAIVIWVSAASPASRASAS